MSINSQKKFLNTNRRNCIRCGTCCQKGGPALHKADRKLVLNGHLKPIDLVTFRTGEPAVNPYQKTIIELPCEMIKIAGVTDTSWQCRFYSKDQSACLIYKYRPLECKTLKCWEPEEVAALFLKDMLSRSDLIPPQNPIWEIITAYEKTFSISLITTISREAASGIKEATQELKKMEKLDIQFRNKVASTFDLTIPSLNFFLGRPIHSLIGSFMG